MPTAGGQELQFPQLGQERVKQPQLRFAGHQTRSKLAQPRVGKAGVGQLQAHSIFPIDAAADGLDRVAIRCPVDELTHRSQGQPGWRSGRLTAAMKQIGSLRIAMDCPQRIGDPHAKTALGKSRPSAAPCFFRDWISVLRR